MSAKKQGFFTRFTSEASKILGRPWVFVTALISLIIWGVSGPLLGFSDTWQLIVNTSTTIITFLMVFVIQNTQNRDNLAINLKLDALLEAESIAVEELMNAEDLSDKALEHKKERALKKNRSSRASRRKSS